ncbi:DMT family transporter [Streptomyces boninensis]|uniref:DMT family transporter n=1 Tax=Streptomyces boninensis TaxID=2039455 RepID=UPI003B216644
MNGFNSLAVALLLALVSAAAYAGAAVLQERVSAGGASTAKALLRGSWWLAVGLNLAGAALHVLALRYGPLTIVQPLGALTLVLALPLQAAVVHRRVSRVQWRGAALTMTGLAGIVLLTRPTGPDQVLSPTQVAITVAATALALAALGMTALRTSSGTVRSLAHATASGVAFGIGSVLTQTVAVRPSLDLAALLTSAAVIALAPAGLMLAQAAYRGGLGAPLATSNLVNPAVAALVGLTLLGEQFSGGALGAAVALAAAVVAARGVFALTQPVPAVAAAPEPRWTVPPQRAASDSYVLTP